MISKSCFSFFRLKKNIDYGLLLEKPNEQEDKFDVTPNRQIPDHPQQTCFVAFAEAMRISRTATFFSCDPTSLQKWQVARASCQRAGMSFRDAVDMPVWGHQTPLQCLVTAYDHQALHFVHSCLPRGFYHGDVYLGNLSDAQPAKVIHDIPSLTIHGELTPYKAMLLQEKDFPFTYRGDKNRDEGGIDGYGVVTLLKGRTYVGRWKSRFTTWLEIPASRELTWLCGARPGAEDMRFLHAESDTSPPLTVYECFDFTNDFDAKALPLQHRA